MNRGRKATVVLIEIFCIGLLVYLACGGVGFGRGNCRMTVNAVCKEALS